jgi:hypothetical protein
MSSLLVFNRRYSQSCWYFRRLLWTRVPLTVTLVHLKSRGTYLYSVNRGGGRGAGCVELHTVYLTRNCFTASNKDLGGEGASDRQTPAARSLYSSIFNKSRIKDLSLLAIWSMGSSLCPSTRILLMNLFALGVFSYTIYFHSVHSPYALMQLLPAYSAPAHIRCVRGQSARHWFPRATRRYLSLHFHNQTVRP